MARYNTMPDAQPTFTPEHVANAIRAVYSPRRDSELTPEDAMLLATSYRSNQAHYRQHIQRSLEENDYLQVAEKAWGAFTQTVKAIGADHLVRLSSHVGIFRVAGQLSDLIAESDPDAAHRLNQAIAMASGLHTHFYENDLTDSVVIQSAAAVRDAVDLLQGWFAPRQYDNHDNLQ